MSLTSTILDLIFPAYCLVCGQRGSDLCIKCLSESPQAERETEKWIYPLYDYRHPPLKRAIWLLKYKSRRGVAKVFAEALYGRIMEELGDLAVMENFREPLLIPIPLSSKRLRERGFNQAEKFCDFMMELDQRKNFETEKDVLSKPKETEHQARIENRAERLRNIIGSFAIKNPEKIKGRNIILIDDVTTTGATLSEARKVLRSAGAKKIIAFSVAH